MHRNVNRWNSFVVVIFVVICMGCGSVAGQTSDGADRMWDDLRAALEELRGNELLGLDGVDYSRSRWVVANAARDSRSFDWLFLEGSGRDFVREYVFVQNGLVQQRQVSSDVQTTRRRERKGSGIFNFLVRDIWWTHYTETAGNYKIRRDVADRHGYRADGSGRNPSGNFLAHAVEVIQRRVTEECRRRFADRAVLLGVLNAALSSDDAEDLAFYRAVFDRIEWPLPPDVCDPDKGPKLMTIFRNAFGEEVEQATSRIFKPPPPSVR